MSSFLFIALGALALLLIVLSATKVFAGSNKQANDNGQAQDYQQDSYVNNPAVTTDSMHSFVAGSSVSDEPYSEQNDMGEGMPHDSYSDSSSSDSSASSDSSSSDSGSSSSAD